MSKAKTTKEIQAQIERLMQEKKEIERKQSEKLAKAFLHSAIGNEIAEMDDKEMKAFVTLAIECYKGKNAPAPAVKSDVNSSLF